MESGPSAHSFWKPFVATQVVGLASLTLSVIAAAGGHGTYVFAQLLLPYATASIPLGNDVAVIGLALAQYPVYGLLLGRANQRNETLSTARAIAIVHGVATLVSFVAEL